MEPSRQRFTKLLRVSEIFYFFLAALSFYLLFSSRTWEAHTVWEVMHPAFIPTMFVATSLLFRILLSSEKVAYKLLFIIVHSVLIHSIFSIVFPTGDLSGQQMFLGRTRLVYDNAVLHGWPPWPVTTVQSQIYEWFRGINFQAALSVAFARMFSIDFIWIHLFLVPVLWGVFTPIAAYLTTYTFTQNEKVAVLSSLLFSAFPWATYFGAISVPNSLGYIFFFYSLYFMLKNLDSNDSKTRFLTLTFPFFSLLSHHLTGIMSFCLLILALVFKSYKGEKSSSITAKVSLVTSFILCASLLPLSLIYLRFFRAATYTAFTLNKLYELPLEEILGLFLIGELTYFDFETILLAVIGPGLALLCIIYLLYNLKRNPTAKFRIHIYFLFAAFLMILVDYRILKLFMKQLVFNEERLWVFQDFIAVPFVALAIYAVVSLLKTFLKATSLPTVAIATLKALSKRSVSRVLSLLFTLNVLIPVILGGWITLSLGVAYPQSVIYLQTTQYELEAVKFIEENTKEKYVVICDVWTIYAGERIVGVNNPRAYYFLEFNRTGYDLFLKMTEDPSLELMLSAMNKTGTDTKVAYFIVTEPRLGVEQFNSVVSKALKNGLQVYATFGNGKLYVFYYKK